MRLCLILSLLIVSALPANAAIIREPYLQLVTPTSITIVWQTDLSSANDSRVQYGTVSGSLNQTALGANPATIPPSNAAVKNHEVTITGLSPATTYFYNVGTVTNGVQAGGTTNHFLVTAPTVGTAPPFRVWVLGDSGDGSARQVAVRDAMLAETASNPPAPDLILHAGDLAYDDGTDPEFTSNHFSTYQNILRHTPLWPSLGNHEAISVNTPMGLGPYYEAHVLPTGGEAGGVPSGTEAYYSFDYANVHFIVLDSMDSDRAIGSTMLTWLQADLAGTTQEWVIALFHHPPYTKGSHDSDNGADSGGRLTDMRENVLPLLEAGGVDLVLGGHSHIYERSYPLRGAFGYGSSPNFTTPSFSTLLSNGNILDSGNGNPSGDGAYQSGTVYVVAGHGGNFVSGTGNHPVMAFSEIQNGSVLLDINGPILTIRNIRSTGAITDTFSINQMGQGNIVWRDTSTGNVGVWLMNGLTKGLDGIPGSLSLTWTIVGSRDVNGDGNNDIVWRNTSTGDVRVWLLNGVSLLSDGISGGAPATWTIVGIGDMNGDGNADIVWRDTSTGSVGVWLMNGVSILSDGIPGGAPTTWAIAGIGDVNGDGMADIVWRDTSTGDVGVWLMNGLTKGSDGVPAGAPLTWIIAGIGDVDGDGMADIVWRDTSTGDVGVWLMNGLTKGSDSIPGSAPTTWIIDGVDDMDADGKADIVWRDTSTGDVGVWLMNGLTIGSDGIPGNAPLVWEIQ